MDSDYRKQRPEVSSATGSGSVAYKATETVQQLIQHGIQVFHIQAQPHQLGLFLNGTQLDPQNTGQTLEAAGVKPGDRLVLRQVVVQGG